MSTPRPALDPCPSPDSTISRRGLSRVALGGASALGATTALGSTSALGAPSTSDDAGPEVLENPGFADGLDRWSVSGERSAAAVRPSSASRAHVLRLAPGTGTEVTVRQRVVVRGGGDRVLRARVRAGGEGGAAALELRTRGRTHRTAVPVSGADGGWLDLAVGAPDARGTVEVALTATGRGGAWAEFDDLELTEGNLERSVRGVDLSGVPKNEACGADYATADGTAAVDPVEVFGAHGATLGRLRVWVDPADGFCTPEHTLAMARRIHTAGMDVLVDFHYSDEWTDPGAQHVPSAWAGLDADGLVAAVADHTRSTLSLLRDAGVDVAMVQVGNEINPGMLWPLGQTWDVDESDGVAGAQWENLARFLTAGSRAVTEVFPQATVMLHLTNINDGIDGLTWWFDEAQGRGVPFDLIGLSYYPYWHGTLSDLQESVTALGERYDRDVIVVETAYPFTLEDDPRVPYPNIVTSETSLPEGYPATPEGQAAFFRAVQDVTVSAAGGHGRGAVYWEPAWTAVEGAGWDLEDPASGNAWENQAMFDHEGRVIPEVFAELG